MKPPLFDAAMSEAQAALREVQKTGRKLQTLIEAAKNELKAIKNSTYLKRDPLLSKGVLERRREDFGRLS